MPVPVKNHIPVYACVATGYGSRSLKESAYLKVSAKRLTGEEMEALFHEVQPELILDATHPYAAVVTENIREACAHAGLPCQRVLREEGRQTEDAVYVESMEAAAEYLKGTEGNVLLTTGSKELKVFTQLPDYQDRLYARVLSAFCYGSLQCAWPGGKAPDRYAGSFFYGNECGNAPSV